MRSQKLFLLATACLVAALISLWSKWNGSAGLHAGYPIDQCSVSFSGSVQGWPAMIGVLCLFAAVLLLVVAIIRAVME